MFALLAAVALQTAPYSYHIATRPGSPLANLQTVCKRFDDAKTEQERRRYLPAIRKGFANYQGDKDELLLRCQRRVEVRQ